MIVYPDLKPKRKDLDPAEIHRNVEMSAWCNLPDMSLEPNSWDDPHWPDRPVAIIAPGKTAKSFLPEIDARNNMLKVLAGSGHRFLNDGSLKHADFVVFNLPIGDYPSDVQPPRNDVRYLIASHCPAGSNEKYPSIFDHMISAGCRDQVELWHANVPGGPNFEAMGKSSIGTGGGAGVAAVAVMAAQGYRNFEMYGVDGSVDFAVDISDLPEYVSRLQNAANQVAVQIDGQTYVLAKNFWLQTQELIEFIEAHPEIKVRFHGDSLNARIFNTPDGKPRRDFEILDGSTLPPPEPHAP